VATGHKTGFYLDQRDNRAASRWVRRLGAAARAQLLLLHRRLHRGRAGRRCRAGDQRGLVGPGAGAGAGARGGSTASTPRAATCADADVNAFLREQIKAGAQFDAIVLDPPKFAPTAAHAERAARAYKDINRLALMLLAPGGLLFTFVFGRHGRRPVPQDRGRRGHRRRRGRRIAGAPGSAPDHPTTMYFPEGEYLKGLAILKPLTQAGARVHARVELGALDAEEALHVAHVGVLREQALHQRVVGRHVGHRAARA
jgi:23S rRNA (cytosine1962-C5)-methyltransferase